MYISSNAYRRIWDTFRSFKDSTGFLILGTWTDTGTDSNFLLWDLVLCKPMPIPDSNDSLVSRNCNFIAHKTLHSGL